MLSIDGERRVIAVAWRVRARRIATEARREGTPEARREARGAIRRARAERYRALSAAAS